MKPCGNCYEKPLVAKTETFKPELVKAACMRISGLGCGNCVTRVKNSLRSLDGVLLVEISLDDGLATVAFDPVRVSPVDLVRTAESAAHDGKHQYWADVITVGEISDVVPQELFQEQLDTH